MNAFEIIVSARSRKWIGYAIALLGPLFAVLTRLVLADVFTGYPFSIFFPPILFAAILGGRIPGAVSALLCAALADYYLMEPHGFGLPWPAGWIGMAAFFVVATIMIVSVDFGIVTGERLQKAGTALQALNDKLEERVAERTRALTLLTARLQDEILHKDEAEAQLRHIQKLQAVGQLTAGIAHDFNNMLSIIIGSLEVFRRRTQRDQISHMRFVDNAMDGAERAAKLTKQLLAFARKQSLAPEVVDLNALVSNLSEMFRRTLGDQIKLECVLAAGVWRSLLDPDQLESAILNLVVNARDAMPDGGRLTIETQNAFFDDTYAGAHAETEPGQYVLIAVTDTGSGMSDQIVSLAFDPFFTTKPGGKGTGLGLSQVYGFVKQSGGHAKIYSEPNHGTTVKLYFPRHTDDAALLEKLGDQSMPALQGQPNEVILVVDDDDDVRAIHVTMLQALQYTVLDAGSGLDALAILQEHHEITLLFTDVVMPGMSGRDLAEKAQLLTPHLKVLYTTGYTPNAVVHNGVIDRGVELIPKPFSQDQLARKIRSVLDRP